MSQHIEQRTSYRVPIAHMELLSSRTTGYERLVGLTPYGTAIVVFGKNSLRNMGYVTQWSIKKRHIIAKVPLTKWVSANDMMLSSDGKHLITSNNRMDLSFSRVRSYVVSTMRTSDLKVNKRIVVKPSEDWVGCLPLPNNGQYFVAKVLTDVRGKKTGRVASGLDRFDWLNITTGKVDKSLRYNPARGCDKILFSPDKRYLACQFTDESFDLLDDKLERSGIVDIIDPNTGKILWHIQGTERIPAGEPLFFISATQFVSSDMLFNIVNKTAKPWSAVNKSRQCVANVPGHPSYAFFLTGQGLQLRNWRRDATVATWPTLTTQGRIFFSPSLEMFGYKRGPLVEFWRLNPQWLK